MSRNRKYKLSINNKMLHLNFYFSLTNICIGRILLMLSWEVMFVN